MSRLKMSIICLCAGYGLIWLSGLASPAWAQESRGKEALEELPGPLLKRKADQLERAHKAYFNLQLPGEAPQLRPIVVSASEHSAIVAQEFEFGNGREIQVLELKEGRWQFVGRNGGAITGKDRNFLQDAKQGSDGRLWVLVQLRSHDFLYSLEDGGWKVKGPPNGHLGGSTVDDGLHFLGTHLVHQFQSEKIQLVGLEGEQWVPVPAQDLVQEPNEIVGYFRNGKMHGSIYWRAHDAWLFRMRSKGDRSTLEAYWVKGPRKEDIFGPMFLESWRQRVSCYFFAVSSVGSIAMIGRTGDLNNVSGQFGRLYHQRKDLTYESQDLPLPPASEGTPDCFDWSPRGVLHAVVRQKDRKSEIHRFENGRWLPCGDFNQRRWFIFNPRLFFHDNGEPIVVWEDFLPQ